MTFRKSSHAPLSRDRPPPFPVFLLMSSQAVLTVGKGRSPATSVPSFQESLWSCDSRIESALPLPRPTSHPQQTAATDRQIANPIESADLMSLVRASSR